MPFREKMKRAFRRTSSTTEGSELAKTSSKASKKDKGNIYESGEMPKPKYRGPYNKAHQDKLSAFSFGEAWSRRKSDQSQYSPMGSRLPSRRGSTFSGRSREPKSRQQSYVGQVVENTDGDDDIANGALFAPTSQRAAQLIECSGTIPSSHSQGKRGSTERANCSGAVAGCYERPYGW